MRHNVHAVFVSAVFVSAVSNAGAGRPRRNREEPLSYCQHRSDFYIIKMMNFAFKMMSFGLNMMNLVFTMMNCRIKNDGFCI